MKIAAALLLACCCAFGQWSNVTRIESGRVITVERKGGGSVKGEFVRATDESVVVRAKQQETSVGRADVVRVDAKRNGHAKWWGLGIGAGAGAIVGAAVDTRLSNESGDLDAKGAAAAIVAVVGALIGLAIGALLDSRHSTIYHA